MTFLVLFLDFAPAVRTVLAISFFSKIAYRLVAMTKDEYIPATKPNINGRINSVKP